MTFSLFGPIWRFSETHAWPGAKGIFIGSWIFWGHRGEEKYLMPIKTKDPRQMLTPAVIAALEPGERP